MLITLFAQLKASSMLLELLSTAKSMASVRSMTSKRTNGSKLTAFALLDPELLSVLSKTTTSLHLEEELTRRISLTRLSATIFQRMCGKKSRVQPWIRPLGSLDT